MTSYEMPEVKIGDMVLFYAHEGADPVMAFVTTAASRTLTLWAVVPGYGGVEKASVHHKDDPGVQEFPAWKEYGFWGARPAGKEAILSEKVALLEKKVAELEGRKGNRQ